VSLSASSPSETNVRVLRYFDVVLIAVAAPIMLLIGVPAVGYLLGAGAWIGLRAVGVAIERMVSATSDSGRQISLRMTFMFSRLFLLALAVIAARGTSKNDGLTALVVIVVGFTLSLGVLAGTRPRSPRTRPGSPGTRPGSPGTRPGSR
jgi:phosphotransferase system  glucose/maltose/N-acetylglucosamine-specific IIC component